MAFAFLYSQFADRSTVETYCTVVCQARTGVNIARYIYIYSMEYIYIYSMEYIYISILKSIWHSRFCTRSSQTGRLSRPTVQ